MKTDDELFESNSFLFLCLSIIEQKSPLIIINIIIVIIIIVIIIINGIGGSGGVSSAIILLPVVMKIVQWVRYFATQLIFIPGSLSFSIMVMLFALAKFAGIVIECLKNHHFQKKKT